MLDSEMMKLRGLGFSQEYIAKELRMSQGNIAYRLEKLKKRAEKEGIEEVFFELCVMQYLPKIMRYFNVR